MLSREFKKYWFFYLFLLLLLIVFATFFIFFTPTAVAKQTVIVFAVGTYMLFGLLFQGYRHHLTWNVFLEYFFIAIMVGILLWPLSLI